MLKAVRFDLEAHEHLLTYIDNYRDKKGKPNYSEAIRVLMEKGYEVLHAPPVVETKVEAQPVDIGSIKDQIYTDIMEELTKKFFSQMGTPAPTFTQVNPTINNIEPIKKEIKTPPPPPAGPPPRRVDTVSISGGSGLLANLLGNASR